MKDTVKLLSENISYGIDEYYGILTPYIQKPRNFQMSNNKNKKYISVFNPKRETDFKNRIIKYAKVYLPITPKNLKSTKKILKVKRD